MTDLSKHPILMQCYELMNAIEECGASEELTRAVIKASGLMDEIEKIIDLIGKPPQGSHPDEWLPRAATWHLERQNWISEVDSLQERSQSNKPNGQDDLELMETCSCGKHLWLRESLSEEGLFVVKYCRSACGYQPVELWKI